MATQVWFHSGFTVGGVGDTPLPKEPPVGYQSETVSTSNVSMDVPPGAALAIVETDNAVAYRVNSAASYSESPIIAATSNSRYVISVAGASTLNFIANA